MSGIAINDIFSPSANLINFAPHVKSTLSFGGGGVEAEHGAGEVAGGAGAQEGGGKGLFENGVGAFTLGECKGVDTVAVGTDFQTQGRGGINHERLKFLAVGVFAAADDAHDNVAVAVECLTENYVAVVVLKEQQPCDVGLCARGEIIKSDADVK